MSDDELFDFDDGDEEEYDRDSLEGDRDDDLADAAAAEEILGERITGGELAGAKRGEIQRGGGDEHSPFMDEWMAQRTRLAEARVYEGRELGDLDIGVRERQIARDDFEGHAKSVNINPYSGYGALFGSQATVTSGNLSDFVASWSGEEHDARAVIVTVAPPLLEYGTRFPTATDSGLNTISYRGYARIQAGSRANMVDIEVDLGQQVCVSGSAVYCQIGVRAAPTGTVAGTLTSGASLSFGPKATATPVTITQFVDALGAGQSTIPAIPRWARRLWVYRTPVTEAMTVSFTPTGGSGGAQISIAANTTPAGPIVVPGDAFFISVDNNGANTINARLVYELTF